ncbi:hypothetical protein D3C72_2095100 [compost metagenome]|jgi:hypothetical protein
MTLPEQQPDPVQNAAETAAPEAFVREVERIDIDELDKDNKGWVVKYLDQLKTRLTNEQAADQPDFVMISYLKNEVATYQELLDRTEKK